MTPTISIVTPWSGQTHPLLPDYAAAVQGCEVITIDNASAPETAAALKDCGGIYIRNEKNAGFAGGNNQGYAKATGDIIVFLNSDVAPAGPWLDMVCADVRDGALYGPSMAQQLVAGRWLPYLEGWCIAATRETWERVGVWFEDAGFPLNGTAPMFYPWDAAAYPGPYWEDNDLCLRAAQAGIALIQTEWPIRHKVGATAGPIMRHAASFAANERTYTDRVLAALGERTPNLTPVHNRYMTEVHTQSDIQHHLPLLYSLASGNIVELGTRSGVSTAAFLAGAEVRGGHVWSIDIDGACAGLYAGHPLWTFIQSDSRNPELPVRTGAVDILFIDTEHVLEIATAELALWTEHVRPGGFILMHDPETFPGVRRAALELATARGWPITFVRPCNGMAIIERPLYTADDVVGVSDEGADWAMEAMAR